MLLITSAALAFSGCGYVHFGRLPADRSGDAALQRAYGDLSLEHKILKQELALARKETDTLRAAMEKSAGAAPSLTPQREDAARELAALRVKYAQLETERNKASGVADAASATKIDALQQENTKLQRELEQSRGENAALAEKLKASMVATQRAETAAAELNADLKSEKSARERAEQATAALRSQLEAVMARSGRAEPTSDRANEARAASDASGFAALQQAKAPPSTAAATAELRTNYARVKAAANGDPVTREPTVAPRSEVPVIVGAKPAPAAGPAAVAERHYTVKRGDTLEKIALQFFGAADQWGRIYSANEELLSSTQGLKPGMELNIPAK